jgi:hypothetical protein
MAGFEGKTLGISKVKSCLRIERNFWSVMELPAGSLGDEIF